MKQFQRMAVFLALVLVSALAFAQGTNSNLTGTVKMDNGSALPGTTITISSPALQGTRTAVSDVNGNYNFPALPPGQYTVKFEMDSMKTVTKQTLVGLAESARTDAEMQLMAVTEAITVTASAPAVLETSEVQTNLQSKMINELPLNRSFQSTANLAPGVTTMTPNGGQLAMSGAPASESLYLVNGAEINENIRSQIQNLFIEDAIQEQTVLTGNISAEYGRFSGGVVTAITKSGGNDFSGSLRDNLTNGSWGSTTPLHEAQLDKVNSVYEGTLGGRIIRDRLWFFGAGRYFKSSNQAFLENAGEASPIPFTAGTKESRVEVKLTGQVTPKHSVVVSYLDLRHTDLNNCFVACYNVENIDASRQTPNTFRTVHYNGILTSNLLLELGYSKKTLAFIGGGGQFSDFVNGTWVYDLSNGGFFGAPVFCGFCSPETRDNKDYNLKSTYYLATKSLGTHNIIGGVDDFAEQRNANNFQSGSNFGLYDFNSPTRAADGSILATFLPGNTIIQWDPIFAQSVGSNLKTESAFVNDKWDLNPHLNFNLGVRYDKNRDTDSSGNSTANDSKVSPRLGLTYDVKGDGKIRFNAGYAEYVSHIQEAVGGSGAAAGGNPAYIQYLYEGPAIQDVEYHQALGELYNWFTQVAGFTGVGTGGANQFIIAAGFPGISTIIPAGLVSPNVREYTAGVGSQLGQQGFVRFDYINRDFRDAYGAVTTTATGQVTDPLGDVTDLTLLENSSQAKRKYDAAIIQAGYRFNPRINLGGNLTVSSTKGNYIAETGGSGPTPATLDTYPEYKAFAQSSPYGPLDGVDQKYKARLFLTAEQPSPIGRFTFGALERFDSGTPFSDIITVDPAMYITNPGYVNPPNPTSSSNKVVYYLDGRGNHRWDNTTATDLSLTYALPITRVNLYLKGDLLNSFNQHAQIGGNTTIHSAASGGCFKTTGPDVGGACDPFNPFTETPVEGINYVKGAAYGTDNGNPANYEVPRTYRFAVGLRF